MGNRTVFTSRGLLTALAGLTLFAGASPLPAQQQSTVRLATLAPRGTSYVESLTAMGEKWRQAPGGGVRLIIYPDGTMGTEADMVRRMRVGQIQAALLTADGLSEIDPSVSVLQKMPMVYRSLDEAEYIRVQMQPKIEKRFADKGFIALNWGDAGWVRFFSITPAITPDEYKKLRLFVTADDNDQVEIMKAAGYRPVALQWSDALVSLQTGLINAVPVAPILALSGQFYTVTHHMLELNWAPLIGGMVITKQAWDALPPQARNAMQDAAAVAGKQIQARSRQESDEAVTAMQKRGLQVHVVTPGVEAEWHKLAETVYPRIRGKMVPEDIYDEVQRLLAQYRAKQGKGQK
jgi:TRAP-type C4-dicarboxylate transport system substrate-binding protein